MSNIRNLLIKRASKNPSFRRELISSLSYRKYVDMERKMGRKPLSKEEWETANLPKVDQALLDAFEKKHKENIRRIKDLTLRVKNLKRVGRPYLSFLRKLLALIYNADSFARQAPDDYWKYREELYRLDEWVESVLDPQGEDPEIASLWEQLKRKILSRM